MAIVGVWGYSCLAFPRSGDAMRVIIEARVEGTGIEVADDRKVPTGTGWTRDPKRQVARLARQGTKGSPSIAGDQRRTGKVTQPGILSVVVEPAQGMLICPVARAILGEPRRALSQGIADQQRDRRVCRQSGGEPAHGQETADGLVGCGGARLVLVRVADLNGELSPRTFGDAILPRQATVLRLWRDEMAMAA